MIETIKIFLDKIYIYLFFLLSVIGFVFLKLKYKNNIDCIKPFLIIGLALIALSSALINIIYGSKMTIEVLVLRERDLIFIGRFIFIGYCFILISIFLFLDSIFNKIFNQIKKNKKT